MYKIVLVYVCCMQYAKIIGCIKMRNKSEVGDVKTSMGILLMTSAAPFALTQLHTGALKSKLQLHGISIVACLAYCAFENYEFSSFFLYLR